MNLGKLKQRVIVLSCLLCMIVAAACTDSDDVGDNYRTFTGETIKDFLEANPEYSEFEQALEKVNALSLMASYGKYTCFIPDNQAVNNYLTKKGFSSFEAFLDSTKAVEQMVYYHIIDGESNGVGTYYTTAFGTSNIETKNMEGRFLYTNLDSDGATWLINNSAKIVSPNNTMVNGVVHTVDQVVEGNDDILSDYLQNDARFSLYAEALGKTGLIDSLTKIEDDTYVQPTTAVKDDAPLPTRRLYGFTALLEPDEILRANGIQTLDDMRAYAESKYPSGKGLDDTNRASSLNMFVAYHLIPYKLTSSQLCPTRDQTVTQTFEDPEWQRENYRDGKYSLDNYLFPMAPNTLINVQKFVWRDQAEQTPIFNDVRNPYNPKYVNMINEEENVVTIDLANSNLDCLNGEVHSLTGMLYYDEKVYHKRLRMDFTLFLPEMWSNDLISGHHTIPRGYCKNITWDDKESVSMKYWIRYGTHSYHNGDMFMVNGRCNADIVIGPIPSGSYEVRIGYQVRTNDYGIVQYYLDGEPCGIPLDMTKTSVSPEIGFAQSWFYLYGGVEQAPFTGWSSGKETEDDYYGYNNDKAMHNNGYMKAGDSYVSLEPAGGNYNPIHAVSARNDIYAVRRVLKMVTWTNTQTHVLRISNLMDKSFQLDYIEFMPKDLIEDEDTH